MTDILAPEITRVLVKNKDIQKSESANVLKATYRLPTKVNANHMEDKAKTKETIQKYNEMINPYRTVSDLYKGNAEAIYRDYQYSPDPFTEHEARSDSLSR